MTNPIFLLEALRRTGDKIALFCEAGQIYLPRKPSKLYILLDQVVNQVVMDKNDKLNAYPSFHPKFWLLRYKNDKDKVKYRIIVLSRNLTFDRSWDISFTMDGEITDNDNQNESLIAFIEYLTDFSTNQEKTDKIKEILKELPSVTFKLNDKTFYDFDLIPNGINEKFEIQNYPLFTEDFNELLIMSPFLSESTIEYFNSRGSKRAKRILITQKNSLGKLKPEDCDNFDIYTLKDQIIDGESLITEEAEEIFQHDIHAKMFMVRQGNLIDIYLGSLNASHNALNGNIEFMVRLRRKGGSYFFDKIADEIFNGDKDGPESPFELVDMSTITKIEEDQNNDLDSIIKQINRLNPKGKITENNGKYDLELLFKPYKSDFDIEIKPLLLNNFQPLQERIIFNNLNKLDLSQFIVIKVSNEDEKVERVIKIPIEGMPDNREDDLINSIVSDEESFISYVTFLLGGDIFAIPESNDENNTGKSNFTGFSTSALNGLYEKMLQTAYQNPNKLNEINFLMKSITEDGIIPEGFEELYTTFKKVVN